MILVLAPCLLVSFLALVSGTTVSVNAIRVTPRVTEESTETRGIVTVPVQRVVQEGRVDVTLHRKILGVIPWETNSFEDVTDAAVTSGSNDTRDSRRRRSSSYDTEALTIRTRSGGEWRSESASGVVGSPPGEVAERLRAFIDGGSEKAIALWWAPWLENLIGIPFGLVACLTLLGLIKMAFGKATG
jgi:hypothetical protein